jgi:hypothetical protein
MYLESRRKGEESTREVGYWRKDNQIHGWFVRNVQDGVDDCEPYPVTKDQLEQLLAICRVVLKEKSNKTSSELLPPMQGFFFGGYSYGEGYYEGVSETIATLEKVLEETDFETEELFYQSSW